VALRTGDEFDGWSLISELGDGGNGTVWAAVHPKHGEAALKVLKRRSGDRWQRFRDEVAVMRRLSGRPGVLPLVAANLPERSSRAWLAMPIAKKAVDALGSNPSLTGVVSAVQEFAATLASLNEERIYHRDIKPGNLFRLNEQWVLGDFGLVTYPDKDAITVGTRRLGPLYFIAPEMLRQPDVADPGPADVYSLAKTLWALAAGQTYPPEGQIRIDTPLHDLSKWISDSGTLSLGLILQQATEYDPATRPNMADFEGELDAWTKGGATRDDRAADAIRHNYVRSLGDQLAASVDPQAFSRTEAELREVISEAKRRSADKRQQLLRDAMEQSETSRRAFIHDYGVKAALDLHDSPWIGSMRDGEDFAYAVTSRDPAERQAELERARKILWGRPLWWAHSVALAGSLKLRGQDGCEPLATELATQEIRDHLLEFAGHPALAAVWRLQRALIPATARIAAYGPLDELAQSERDSLSAEDRIRYEPNPGRVMMNTVRRSVQLRLREQDWTSQALNSAADEAEKALKRIPIPAAEWDGPMGDPWLQSWSLFSPLVMCGLAILVAEPSADDLLAAPDLQRAIKDAAHSEFELLRRSAVPLAERLGI
jgi:hypothetical protein